MMMMAQDTFHPGDQVRLARHVDIEMEFTPIAKIGKADQVTKHNEQMDLHGLTPDPVSGVTGTVDSANTDTGYITFRFKLLTGSGYGTIDLPADCFERVPAQ